MFKSMFVLNFEWTLPEPSENISCFLGLYVTSSPGFFTINRKNNEDKICWSTQIRKLCNQVKWCHFKLSAFIWHLRNWKHPNFESYSNSEQLKVVNSSWGNPGKISLQHCWNELTKPLMSSSTRFVILAMIPER